MLPLRRLILMLLLAAVATLPALAQGAQTVVLQDGAPIAVHSKYDISTKDVRTNEGVLFVTGQAVVVGGTTLVEKGAPVRAGVLFSQGPAVLRGGHLVLVVDSVQAVDGTWIPVRASQGDAESGARLVLDRGALRKTHGGFATGHDVMLSSQDTFTLYVDQPHAWSVSGTDDPASPRVTALHLEPALNASRSGLKLAEGTPVVVQPARDISSGKVKNGQAVDFVVSDDVLVHGHTVISRGALARGSVAYARRAGLVGSRGELALTISQVQAVDGSWVAVSSNQERPGGSGLASVITPPGLPTYVGILTTILPGTNAVVPRKHHVLVYVHDNRWFTVARNDAHARPVAVNSSDLMVAETHQPLPHSRTAVRAEEVLGLEVVQGAPFAAVAPETQPLGATTPRLYACWRLTPADHARSFDVVWLHDERTIARSRNVRIDAAATSASVPLDPPAGGFRPGRYTVMLQSAGRVLRTREFAIR